MKINLLVGRSLSFRAQRRSRSSDRKNEPCLRRVGSDLSPDQNLARDLTRIRPVCTENPIRVDDVTESPKLVE